MEFAGATQSELEGRERVSLKKKGVIHMFVYTVLYMVKPIVEKNK